MGRKGDLVKLTYTQQFTYRDLPDDLIDRYGEPVCSVPFHDVVEPDLVRSAYRHGLDEMMHAALDINMPNYATAIVTTKEAVASISSL